MSKHHGSSTGGKAHFGPGHILGLFLFYAVLAFCVLAFTFYFVFVGGEARLMVALTLALAIIATIVHVKMGRRDRIDTLIDRGP
jgi:hypothetical protein